jgi:pimeloyl-ACP methyl ester carboxylesterase
MEALRDFYIATQRRLSMAGKILFPIPNRRLSKRLYRLTAETLLVWGAADKLIMSAYAKRWQRAIPSARVEMIDGAGHMVPYEQPDAFVQVVQKFLA